PGRVGGAVSAASSGGAHLGVNRRTRHPELAVALVRFLAEAEAQKTMTVGGALNPTRMALYHDRDVVRVHPDFPLVHDLMLLAPALLALAVLAAWPGLWVLWLSLQRRIPVFGIERFVGPAHYAFLAEDPRFWNAVQVTLIFTFVSVSLEFLLGLGVALGLQ